MITDERVAMMAPRGGAREGAGRKKGSGEGPKRVAVSISMMPDEREQLKTVSAELGVSQSDFVRLALKHAGVLAALYQEESSEL